MISLREGASPGAWEYRFQNIRVMELGIIHRASIQNPQPAPAAGTGNAQATAETIPCGEQVANPPGGRDSGRHYP